jgi:hypothetical protein
MSRDVRRARRTVAALLAVLAVAGCTSADDPVDPPSTPTSTAGPTGDAAPEWTADELVEAVHARPEEEAIASADGEVAYQEVAAPARAEVLEVRAGDASTTVVYRLTYLGDGDLDVGSSYFSPERAANPDARGLALQLPEENRRLRPYLAVDDDTTTGAEPTCMCTRLPMRMFHGRPMLQTATFPALGAATTTVDLEMLGFPLLAGIPVTRD